MSPAASHWKLLHVSKDTVKRIYAYTENNAQQSIMFCEYSFYIRFSIKYENF
jgi:hypothetical protein